MLRTILTHFQLSSLCLLFCSTLGVGVASGAETIRLFEGDSLSGWTFLDGSPVDSGWEVRNRVLHLKNPKGSSQQIITERTFGDFDLRFEWKMAAPGNSGVKYRVQEYGNRTLGLEYQLLDDGSKNRRRDPRNGTASIYDLFSPDVSRLYVKPPGEFNHSRIVVRCNRVQHYLNGQKVLDVCIGSSAWFQAVADSKFSEFENFGLNGRGRILIQDHKTEMWFRNVTLTELDSRDMRGPRRRAWGLRRLFFRLRHRCW